MLWPERAPYINSSPPRIETVPFNKVSLYLILALFLFDNMYLNLYI